jgi:hypothetical protein
MAVVINEFEVIPGEVQRDSGAGTSPGSEAQDRQPSLREIELMIEEQIERGQRVRSH